jgi:hypothetical protein
MIWTKPNFQPTGFAGADSIFGCDTHLIAIWNHDHCRGWQLYQLLSPRNYSRIRWLNGAGRESVGWTADQAVEWAERQLAQNP